MPPDLYRLKPGMIVVERLRFQSPELSKRLNRIVQNCGRKVVADKLEALEEEFEITGEEVNAAYMSQTCSACGYVDARNHHDQRHFECLLGSRTPLPGLLPLLPSVVAGLGGIVARWNLVFQHTQNG